MSLTQEQKQAFVSANLKDKNLMNSLSGKNIQPHEEMPDDYYTRMATEGLKAPEPMKTTQPEVAPVKKGFLSKAANFLVSSEKKFGETLGTALSTIDPQTQKNRDYVMKQSADQYNNYMELARKETNPLKKQSLLQAAKSSADTAGIDIYNNPEYQKTAKQVIGEATGVLIDIAGAGSLAKAGTKAIKSGLAKEALAGTAKVGLKEGAKAGAKAGAIFGGAKGISTGMEEDKNLGGIAISGLEGAATGAVIGGAVGAVSGKLASRKLAKEQEKFSKLSEQMSPELTGQAKRKAYTEDFGSKVKKEFITGKTGLKPTEEAERLTAKFQDILDHKKLPHENQQLLGQKMKKIESVLTKELEKDPTPVIKKAFNDGIDDLKRTTKLREGKEVYKDAVDFAKEIFSKSEPNIKGLRSTRNSLDNEFKSAFPSAVKDGKIDINTAAGSAWKDVRNYINNYLYSTAKKGSTIQKLIADEADIFRANELLGKVSSQLGGKGAIGRLIKKHPTAAKTAEGVAIGAGLTGGAIGLYQSLK